MILFFNTNVPPLSAQRHMFSFGQALNSSFGNSSSGFRVNCAADDAAGLFREDGYGADGLSSGATKVSNFKGAFTALSSVAAAISTFIGVCADLGTLQNKFQFTIHHLSNTGENIAGACSRISDTDFAVETVKLTKEQTVQRGTLSVLIQANQRSQLRCNC